MICATEHCERCNCEVQRKPRARKPKYCTGCRHELQAEYRNSIQNQHRQNTQRARERFKNLKSSNLENDFYNA